ncbi:MAG: GTPase HflX [Lachnospiraceae bacterium]|nr:GTPase HflX [Lachnospiraceae bacterium]
MNSDFEKEDEIEKAVLVGVELNDPGTGGADDFERSMEELGNLAKACFMEPVAVVTQKMESINKGLYIGTGKVEEVREVADRLEADLVIFDDALTPSQLRNLQDELGKPILDRTTLILDIFESRARTREAKLQVESARLQYLLPRLVGMHEALTRQGGTSGSMSSRGAGEKKLELDRRKIEHRISELRRELDEVSKERNVQRKKRQASGIPMAALVGYTNAGKSTIMNAMVDAYVKDNEKRVLEKDMLFATLDTSVRRINTGNNRDFLLSDTVGFIHKLPHSLVKAFRSTLEEVKNADLLLHVVDYSDPFYAEQMKTTAQTLSELGAGDIPMITVYNKADLCSEPVSYPKRCGDRIYISAKEETSLQMLVETILEYAYSDYVEGRFLIPYDKGNIVSYFRENAHIIHQEYLENGTELIVKCHKADRDKFSEYEYGKRETE